jgi:CBS domain-containing protein
MPGNNVRMTTSIIVAFLSDASRPNPLIHIKAAANYMTNYPADLKRSRGPMKAADVMATSVISVRLDTPVTKIAEVLLANRISAVPVVNDKDVLVGIVSEGDLIRRVEAGTERHRSWWLELLTGKETLAHEFVMSHARAASDVMTRPVVSVTPDTSLGDIASLLEKHRIKRVPVAVNGKIVGIVSRANLIQALVSQAKTQEPPVDDAVLHDNIVDALRAKPWVDPSTINVIVNDGSVELWGIVDSETEKNAIRVAVEVMPGVRRVANKLVVEHLMSTQ